MEGASCQGSPRTLPSLESKRMQPMSGQENKPPPASLCSLDPNCPRALHVFKESSSPQEQQACSTSNSSSRDHPPRRPLQPLTISLPGVNTPSSCQQPYFGGGKAEEKEVPASVFQFPPPLHHNPPFNPSQNPPFHHAPYHHQPKKERPVTCVVEQEGHLCLQLRLKICYI